MNDVRREIAVLIIDNVPDECEPFISLINTFGKRYKISGYDEAQDWDRACQYLNEKKYDLILLDIHFGDQAPRMGFDILERIRNSDQHSFHPLIILTKWPDEKFQEDLLGGGADGFLDKEHDCMTESLPTVECILDRGLRVGELRKKYLKFDYGIQKDGDPGVDLFGFSRPMRQLFQQIFRTVADYSPPTVLITGGTGTGKSSVARAIWALGPRAGEPFSELIINTIPRELVASELFGHKKGAFTGAGSDKPGLIRACDKGTLFLDEIGDLPRAVQVMLLQALRERKIRMIGGDRFDAVDFQLVSATNRNLDRLVMSGKFRADLYHRIRGVHIEIPSLRDRFASDARELDRMKEREQEHCGFRFRFTAKALDLLRYHAWPGNYAEFKTLIVELATLCSTVVDDHMVIKRLLKPEYFAETGETGRAEAVLTTPNYRDAIRVLQDFYFRHWLAESSGNVEEMAKRIKVNPSTIHRWRKRMGRSPSRI